MNRKANKKPLQLRRSIRAGLKVGIFILTAVCTVEIAKLGWETFTGRSGAPGGELLIIPLTVLLFLHRMDSKKRMGSLQKSLQGGRKEEIQCKLKQQASI